MTAAYDVHNYRGMEILESPLTPRRITKAIQEGDSKSAAELEIVPTSTKEQPT